MKNIYLLAIGLLLGSVAYPQTVLEFTVAVTDISTDTTINFKMPNIVNWSMQINSVTLAGTLDGTVDLLQSNDRVNFNRLAGFSLYTLATADTSVSYESEKFTHQYFAFKITKNNLTGGNVKLFFKYIRP